MLGRGDSLSCKSSAFTRSKLHYCQTRWFQAVFVVWLIILGRGRWLSFHARAMLSLGRSCTIAKHAGFRRFLWFGSSCWEEVTLFSCKSSAFTRSKLHYCQTRWFQAVFCGLAHHVGKRLLSFHARALLSLGRSCTIAKHAGFRGFLWFDSSCWEEVGDSLSCKSSAFTRSKLHYCQTRWFQVFFVVWLFMLGRGDSLFMQELCFH